jgi:hypothetical protein
MAAQDLKITYLALAVVLPKADGYGFSGYATENDIVSRHPGTTGYKNELSGCLTVVRRCIYEVGGTSTPGEEQFIVLYKVKRRSRRCIVSMHHILCKHLVTLWESRWRTEGSAESKTHLHPPRSGYTYLSASQL